MNKKSNVQILKFYFKLSEKFAEKQSTKSFLESKDNISQRIYILNRYS